MNKITDKQIHTVPGELLGLDIGEKRIGVARVHTSVKIPEPLVTIHTAKVEPFNEIIRLVAEYDAQAVIIGLPRGLEGQETDQTRIILDFVKVLKTKTKIQLYLIDEAGTSQEAKERLQGSDSISIDSMAAAILLEDFINQKDVSLLKA